MNQIKAIETRYKGYRFRSRLEARWAVFFDSLSETWDYEREGFSLPSGAYLPDFYLPRLKLWLEIKGTNPTDIERVKCEELAYALDAVVAIAVGLPQAATRIWRQCRWRGDYEAFECSGLSVFLSDCTDGSAGTQWWDDAFWAIGESGSLCICSNNDSPSRGFSTANWNSTNAVFQISEIKRPLTIDEVNTSRGARFEHGESP